MVNFPQTLDDDNSLFLAVNNKRTALSSDMTDAVTTANVVTTAGFPDTGYISILTGSDILNTEAITYSGIDSTNFLNLGRGAGNTIAVPHLAGDDVDLTIVAAHHNILKDAVIEIENFLGTEDSKNFVPFTDGFNVILPETLTVSGTISVGSEGDFKDDVNVSGTLFVGELPVSTTPKAKFQFEDTIFNTGTDNTYQKTGVSIVPDSGLNLVLWHENASAGSEGISAVELKATYLGSDLAEVEALFSTQGGHWNASELMGFKVIDANGTSAVELQARATSSSRSGDVGAQQLISVPLEQMALVSGTDFWYDNGIESDTAITTTLPTETVVTSMPVNVTEAGPYLVMMSHDTKQQLVASFGRWAARLYVNESNVSSHMDKQGTNVAAYQNAPWAQVVNLNAGLNTIELRAGKWTGAGTVNMRRARLCVINGSSFDQMQGTRSFADVSNNTDTFNEITALSQTYTPNQREQVLVFGCANSQSDDITGTKAVATYKIRDDTDGIDYATDFGTPVGLLSSSIHAFSFALKENTIDTTDWKMFIREANSSSNTGTMNHGAMAIWSLSTNPVTSTQFTRITGSKVLSPEISADTMTVLNSGTLTLDGGDLVAPTGTFSTSLTISGVPVSTGTGGGASTLQDAYDGGDGTISTTGGKPFELTGTGELTAVTGTFTTGLTVGEGSTNIFNESITTGSGIFTDSLTVSGVPVDITGGGGGGSGNITDINAQTGPSITITGIGSIQTITEGNTITITGTASLSDGFRGAFVNTSSGVTLTSAAAPLDMPWDEVNFDTDGFFNASVDDTIFTIPAGINKVRVTAGVLFEANSTGSRMLKLRGDNSVPAGGMRAHSEFRANDSSNPSTTVTSAIIDVVEGNTFKAQVQQNSGGDLDIPSFKGTFFSIEVKDPVAAIPIEFTTVSGTFTQSLTADTTITFTNLPTSSGGLPPGQLFRDVAADNTLKVAPQKSRLNQRN